MVPLPRYRGALVSQVMCASTMFQEGCLRQPHRPYPSGLLMTGRRAVDWQVSTGAYVFLPNVALLAKGLVLASQGFGKPSAFAVG